jgi:hypothetical protein
MILDNKQVNNAAIVLNNIGVDLLERRCYNQALSTLVDATCVMQAVLRRLSSSESNSSLDVEAMIQRANRCRANPAPMESKPYYRIVNFADDYSGILVGEDNNDGSASLRESSIFPLRIYDVSYDACSPGCLSDPEIQHAILLHNMGLAKLCLYQVAPRKSRTSLKNAIQLFEVSESIVEIFSDAMEDQLTLRQAACLKMAILFGLLRSLSSEVDIEYVQLHLRSLRSALSESEEAYSWLIWSTQCAPAA